MDPMSYCRWSCDLHRSDLYVYESQEGWVSHVAGRRLNVDPPEEILAMDPDDLTQYVAHMRWLRSLEVDGDIPDSLWLDLSTIGEEADQHYVDATPGECLERLRALKVRGFNVPAHAIERLEVEAGGDS